MTTRAIRRAPMSGAQLVSALIAIVIATAVIPPAAAWWLNAGRISQTSRRVTAAIGRLATEAEKTGTGMICGPGRLPGARPTGSHPAHTAWLRELRSAPELFGAEMPTDAWGRCFLMNIGAWASGDPVWLLSAGPNGLMDTPPTGLVLGGDDIGGRLR
jgi:hypothetical protein